MSGLRRSRWSRNCISRSTTKCWLRSTRNASCRSPRRRRELLHRAAQLLETPDLPRADLARLAVHRQRAAEIRGKGDAPRLQPLRLRHGARVGHRRRVVGERIERVPARHGVEEQRHVRHAARHRPLHGKRREQIVRRAPRDAPRRRPEPGHGAIGARPPQAARVVAPVREPRFARRHAHRAAARRAAAGQRRVPRVARPPEHLVEGGAAGAELRRVGLGRRRCRPCARSVPPAGASAPARGRGTAASRRWSALPPRRPGP